MDYNDLPPEAQSLISKIKRKTVYQGECWTYYYGLEKAGYARVMYKGQRYKLHRLIAHLYHGLPIWSPLLACHKPECKFKNCWRPEHIYVGTDSDNTKDQVKTGKFSSGWANYQSSKTHCPRGHKLEVIPGEYGRRCKICYPKGHKLVIE